MGRDGICRVEEHLYSKTVRFYDINYQLAQNEDKNTIFESWCDFLNYFDASIRFQLSFINHKSDMSEYNRVIQIEPQHDQFDDVRMEYAQMLKQQLAKGNNGLVRTKYITFSIEAKSVREAKPRLERIETDILNNFKVLGVKAYPLNGVERLQIMYETFHQEEQRKFDFSYDRILQSGMTTKDFIAPTSFLFKSGKDFMMGDTYGAASYLNILAPELTDKVLAEFLDMDKNLVVSIHVQSVDQLKAIKLIKGKITDLIASKYDYVVRYQGGNNAGHTVVHGDKKLALHLMPSGVMYENAIPVIGNGVVVDPGVLVKEMAMLQAEGISCKNLKISCDAHVIMPWHKDLDGADEKSLGEHKIGTTKRGIGPTYADKARRIGVRMADMRDPSIFDEVLRRRIRMANAEMERMGLPAMDEEEMVKEVSAAADVLRPHITNTIPVMNEAIASGKSILFEGAQGAYLDVDFGTYPFVTSSNTSSAGACTGTGVPPHKIDRIIGVCKAYTTRVGAGPFVTEDEDISNHLHSMGREFGATTGRPRRCGWADGVLLHFSAMFNGFDEMAMTNLDGYDKCPEIKICTGYDLDGEILAYPPATVDEWERCKPVYETMPGWLQDISSCRSWEEIPENAKKFVKRMSELIGCPVTTVGVGPDREQTIAVK